MKKRKGEAGKPQDDDSPHPPTTVRWCDGGKGEERSKRRKKMKKEEKEKQGRRPVTW
jgi:hypothetical protein